MHVIENKGIMEVYYTNIEHCNNIVIIKRKPAVNDAHVKLKELNVLMSKGSFFLITTEKESVHNDKDNMIIDVFVWIKIPEGEDWSTGKYYAYGNKGTFGNT